MFQNRTSSGKHLVLDIKNIRNPFTCESIMHMLDGICDTYNLTVINKTVHNFDNSRKAFTALYLLAESHLSVHSFPERNAIMLDLYCCREWGEDCPYDDIKWLFRQTLDADVRMMVLDRYF